MGELSVVLRAVKNGLRNGALLVLRGTAEVGCGDGKLKWGESGTDLRDGLHL